MLKITSSILKIRNAILICCLLSISLFTLGVFLTNHFKSIVETENSPYCQSRSHKFREKFWRKIDLLKDDVPKELENLAATIKIQSNSIIVNNSTIHYIFSVPKVKSASKITVLLLHGHAFSSVTWKKLGTMNLLAAFGYFTVAVDLPGFGDSPKTKVKDPSGFINGLVSALRLTNIVLISPSMSGTYALSFLIKHSNKLKGFIPVSPMGTSVLRFNVCGIKVKEFEFLDETCLSLMQHLKSKKPVTLECIRVPTVIVFGEHDRGANSAKLCYLPYSQAIEIPKGSHAAYLSDRHMWHKILYNFLEVLSNTSTCRN